MSTLIAVEPTQADIDRIAYSRCCWASVSLDRPSKWGMFYRCHSCNQSCSVYVPTVAAIVRIAA